MKYIAQKRKTSPRTRCAKVVKHPKSVTKTGHKRKVPPPNKQKLNYMTPIQERGYLH